ncbi:MAG TPA: branched-chain amino acid transport [Treponema sp.]|nr:branched-chain amino acid transport [Treponema sp.]
MNSQLTLAAVLSAVFVSALVILATRAFPFLLFSRRNPPRIICFIEKYIPPMVMAILVVYCLKDIRFESKPWGLPSFTALAFTTVLHLWRRNPMISIFGGTIVYMILSRML